MTNPINEATDKLKSTDKQFVIIAEGENNKGLEIHQRFGYKCGMAMFAAISNSLMDDYVEKLGSIVYDDLYNVLERTIELNDKRPQMADKALEKIQKKLSAYQFSDPISSKNNKTDDVADMIHALRCCAELNCVECPRFIDEDEDGENKYTSLCNQALMIEAALMLEEYADGTRRREDERA